MKKIILLLFIIATSTKGYSCEPTGAGFGEISFIQDSINPLRFYFSCKIYGSGFCSFQTDSCVVEWTCPGTGIFAGLHLVDTIVVNSAYPQAPILIYGGWHTFDSIPPDSLVYATFFADSRQPAMNDDGWQQNYLGVEVTLNFAYLAHHTGVKSAYFNGPIVAYGTPHQVLYFDPQIQYEQGDSLWVTLTPPLVDCNSSGFITNPTDYQAGSHNVMTMYCPTGLLIWDSPQEQDTWDIAYLVSGYRDGMFAYSTMRDMLIKIFPASTGISEVATGVQFRCYPSPTSGNFTIDMTGYKVGEKQISIYDQLGQVVYQTVSMQDKIQVNENLSSGIYTVAVTQGTRQYTRVVIE